MELKIGTQINFGVYILKINTIESQSEQWNIVLKNSKWPPLGKIQNSHVIKKIKKKLENFRAQPDHCFENNRTTEGPDSK